MEDCFIILYEKRLLVILRNLHSPFPLKNTILDWYASEYAFDRSKLTGYYIHSIDCVSMKYEDFAYANFIKP